MLKTLSNLLKVDKEKYKIPRRVQDVIPIRRIWPDGIFLCGNQFCRTWRFSDINYQVASEEDKKYMFLDYSELLNSLSAGSTAKITVNNRTLNRVNFEQSVLMPMRKDQRDFYRKEFNIHDLGEQLKPTGLLVITDTMLNRVTLNWKMGKRTHVFIDEFHVVFENEYSGNFFNSAWRQFRKRNAYPTAITQNVEYLLDSVQASTMLSNSEFIIMLNQAASDREKLAKLLNISKEQMSYVTNADAGCGLIKYGSALVPFVNRWPRQTKLYDLMTTRPGEGVFGGEKQEVQE